MCYPLVFLTHRLGCHKELSNPTRSPPNVGVFTHGEDDSCDVHAELNQQGVNLYTWVRL